MFALGLGESVSHPSFAVFTPRYGNSDAFRFRSICFGRTFSSNGLVLVMDHFSGYHGSFVEAQALRDVEMLCMSLHQCVQSSIEQIRQRTCYTSDSIVQITYPAVSAATQMVAQVLSEILNRFAYDLRLPVQVPLKINPILQEVVETKVQRGLEHMEKAAQWLFETHCESLRTTLDKGVFRKVSELRRFAHNGTDYEDLADKAAFLDIDEALCRASDTAKQIIKEFETVNAKAIKDNAAEVMKEQAKKKFDETNISDLRSILHQLYVSYTMCNPRFSSYGAKKMNKQLHIHQSEAGGSDLYSRICHSCTKIRAVRQDALYVQKLGVGFQWIMMTFDSEECVGGHRQG